MARIAGINIPLNKHIVIALTSIYGIGDSSAKQICEAAGVAPETPVKDLAEPEVVHLGGEGVEPRDVDEHQATDGPRLLSRHSSSPRPAAQGAADANQCQDAQGPASTDQEIRNRPLGRSPTGLY